VKIGRSPASNIALAFALISAAGCAAPEPGWQRLWPGDWDWDHHEQHWVRGVEANGRVFEAGGGRPELRAKLLNICNEAAVVRLDGPDADHEWRLASGEARHVAVELVRGRHRFSAPAGVTLGSPRIGRPVDEPRLLVLVVVDTLRADHVRPELTPGVLDHFEGGRRWSQATANCSWTLPSVASFFTAQPVLHLTPPDAYMIGIPEGLPTWATELEAAGFEGAAVVANYTIHALNGFARGFATYLVPDGHGKAPHPDAEWVVGEAGRWLEAHRGEDAFLYLHLMDPHEPYRSHGESRLQAPDLNPLAMRRREATADETATLARLYAGEVRHVDETLTPFLASLPDEAVLIFTSDHGEALGEHGAWGHGLNLYQEALAVPLLMSGPGVPAGEVTEPVQLLDLGPTLLELLGVGLGDGMDGRSLLAGGPRLPLVSMTFGGGPLRWAWRAGDHKVVLRMAPQPWLEFERGTRLREGRPLPIGAFHFDLAVDSSEAAPGPVPIGLLGPLGAAFASTAGRMVPGLQLLSLGGSGPAEMIVEFPGEVGAVHAWSTAPVAVTRTGTRLSVHCDEAFPLCALAAPVVPAPAWIGAPVEGMPWHRIAAGERSGLDELLPPECAVAGSSLWWNSVRTLIVGGHEETIERLRTLGYFQDP